MIVAFMSGNVEVSIADATLSIRKGKYGPYIFFKTDKMKRPIFKNFKGRHWENDFECKDGLRDWIRSEYEI